MKRRMSVIMFLALALTLTFAAGCNKGDGSTPTGALKAYYDAARRKDFATAKKYLSQNTMKLMEEGARRMGKSLDETMKEGAFDSPAVTPEFTNEKISGDTATVDIKAEGMTISMPMVKEGGEWKIAMDKLLQNMGSQMDVPSTTAPQGATMPQGTNDNDSDHDGGHDEK